MPVRQFQQFQRTLEKNVVTLYAYVTIGSSGAPTLINTSSSTLPNQSQGIQSIVRNSAGNYTITFGDPNHTALADLYTYLVDFDYSIVFGTVSVISNCQVWADNSSSGNIILQFYAPTNSSTTTTVATDPDNGATLLLKIVLKQGAI